MSGIGDVLWTTPFLSNLRRAYPGAHIAYIVRRNCAFVLENNPDIDELIVFEDERLSCQLLFLWRLSRKRFDLAIDLVCTPATAIQSFVSGAKTRIGFDFRIRQRLYTHRLSRIEANHGHEVEFNLFVLPFLGIPEESRTLVWNVSDDERAVAQGQWNELGFSDSQPVIAFIPTGGYPSKKWPASHFAELANGGRLSSDYRYLVFWGSEAERNEAGVIAALGGEAVVVAPANNLRHTAALLSRCIAAVGNDSGPTHVATALGIPVVMPYGPSDERNQGPWSSRARVVTADDREQRCCRRTDCPDPVCMTGIDADRVARALHELLSDPAPRLASESDQ